MTESARTIGNRYILHEIIGQGAMGDVYRGEDTVTGEQVAVKAIKHDLLDPEMAERFEREAEALRRLNHPNIVKLLDRVVDDKQTYIVMEYVGGGDLRTLIRQQEHLPIRQTLEIALDLADALTRAHRLNIIHRDIKPANVLLADDGTPRLSDFGIAKMADHTAMTETGSLIGTYSYISPEQCMSDPPSPRSDIWAFGVMLFEMLTGTRPFEADNPITLLRAIIADPVPDIRTRRDDLPPALVALINTMLQKDPEARVSSARVIAVQIEALLDGTETPILLTSDSIDPLPNTPKAAQTGEIHVDFGTPTPSERLQDMQQALSRPDTGPPPTSPPPEPAAKPARQRSPLPLILGVVAVLLVGGLLAVLLRNAGGAGSDMVITVDPVADDEYMVLVSDFTPRRNTEAHAVGAEISENLRGVFERGVASSKVRIRDYPAAIPDAETALAIAEANGARVVVWGIYDDVEIRANVTVGSLVGLPETGFDRADVEEVGNGTYVFTDPLRESLAYGVSSALAPTLLSHNRVLDANDMIGIVYELGDINPVEAEGNGVAANFYRYISEYASATEETLASTQRLITLTPQNPLAHASHGLVLLRLAEYLDARQSLTTAGNLAPDAWVMPDMLIGQIDAFYVGDFESGRDAYRQATVEAPDDFFTWTMLGALEVALGNRDAAYEALQTAIAQEPENDYPFFFALPLALERGEISTALDYADAMRDLPDPRAAERLSEVSFGSADAIPLTVMTSAFSNFNLGAYSAAIDDIEAALAFDYPNSAAPLNMLLGLSYCNLGEHDAARNAYNDAIDANPSFALLYLLRAEAHLNSSARPAIRTLRGADDFRTAARLSPSEEFDQLLTLAQAGEVSCDAIFDVNLDGPT